MPEACRELLKERPDLKEDEPNRMIVKMIEESFNEPFKTGPLIDQHGHYAIFDILMNRQMFEYITVNHLNTKAGQAANADLAVDFPAGQNDRPAQAGKPAQSAAFGSFMLKVSWKILTPEEIAAKTFHMRRALVLMPPGEKRPCLDRTLGLIGFHAVHKTVARPQWIWTSFEHVKNVPDRTEVAANKLGGSYNFFSVKCKADCPTENATPPFPWDPDPALELRFRKDDSFKSQIVRETPLTDAAKNMNAVFHSMLPANNVWQNYMLLSTQWPSAFAIHCTGLQSQNVPDPKTDFFKQPDMTCSPAPTYLANSTLETYSQADKPADSKADSMASPPGFSGGASRHVQLHRLPQQRRGLPENRIESGGRQTEPEPVGFHVHAGKGAVGGPAPSIAISWTLMVGSTMGTLPKDRHNDRPGATPSEHDGSFSRRAMLAGTVATTAVAAVAPISGSAYAAGPDVSSPQDMMAFLLLSEALTGVDKLLLAPELELNKDDVISSKPGTDPINIKNDYFRWINAKDSTSSFATLLKFVKDNPKSSQSDIIAFVNAGNDDIKFLARSIVLLWYLGSWYDAEGSAKASHRGQPRPD